MTNDSGCDTINAMLARAAESHAERTALIDAGGRCTYREMFRQVCRFARLLHEAGIRPGDRVALLMPTSIMHTVAVLGCMCARAVPSSLHIRESARTLSEIGNRLAPRAIVFDLGLRTQADGMLAAVPSLEVSIGAITPATPGDAATAGAGLPWLVPRDLAADGMDGLPDMGAPSSGDAAAIVMSSGTTSVPKGVVHTHRTLLASAANGAHYLLAEPGRCGINVFSTGFIGWYNCTLPYLMVGATLVLMTEWEPVQYLRWVHTERVASCILVPTMWRMVLRSAPEDYDLRSLLRVGFAGEKMDPDTFQAIRQRICAQVMNSYGATETGTWAGCTMMLPEDYGPAARLDSIGRPARGVELRIVRQGGGIDEVLGAGEEGEVVLRGPSVASEIWRQPELTRQKFEQGWWRSGDLGTVDADGYVYLKGRTDDMIVTGGINVLPNAVEEVICRHPAVRECVVVGLPDPAWGQLVVAFVVVDRPIGGDELEAYVRDSDLPNFQRPRRYRIVAELPKGNTGKVNRKALRDQYGGIVQPAAARPL